MGLGTAIQQELFAARIMNAQRFVQETTKWAMLLLAFFVGVVNAFPQAPVNIAINK